jgi:hypothetical protein
LRAGHHACPEQIPLLTIGDHRQLGSDQPIMTVHDSGVTPLSCFF